MTNPTTPNGKEITVRQAEGTSLLEVAFVGGGERPKEFEGLFTDITAANKVISAYLNRLETEAATRAAKQHKTDKAA